ncbi:hypothetical protein FA15DRAFT_752905 [Coprinopsis marcescibilis]|uniref:Uncharacterized protein n=1 Tax=Coprinopsis marcescibilis TaxID=230819 RepID=A0A5C3L8I7_COPMA|nr:hypothetical protein FA15DRAFT_752905 [Coprinopsis marcescibilis]
MSTADAVLLIHDSSSPIFEYRESEPLEVGRNWTFEEQNPEREAQRYDNTTSYIYGSVEAAKPSSLALSFQGTSVSLFGPNWEAETSSDDTLFGISWRIDGSLNWRNITTNGDLPFDVRASGQWFTSPTLSDAFHRLEIEFRGFVRVDLDYAVVTGGTLDRYNNQTAIIVDDNQLSEIFYFGSWRFATIGLEIDPSRLWHFPFQNGTHRTATVGSGFRFKFSGTAIRIYGVKDRERGGALSLDFTLDNGPPETKKYDITPLNGSQGTALPIFAVPQFPNWLMAEFTGLAPGEHTLTANLTSIDNIKELIFDYVVYTPDFPNLGSKPKYDVSLLDPAFDKQESGSGGGNLGSRTIGAIVGGVLGAVALIAILFLVWSWRRRSKRRAGDTGVTVVPPDGILPYDILGAASPPPYTEMREAPEGGGDAVNQGVYLKGAQQPANGHLSAEHRLGTHGALRSMSSKARMRDSRSGSPSSTPTSSPSHRHDENQTSSGFGTSSAQQSSQQSIPSVSDELQRRPRASSIASTTLAPPTYISTPTGGF